VEYVSTGQCVEVAEQGHTVILVITKLLTPDVLIIKMFFSN